MIGTFMGLASVMGSRNTPSSAFGERVRSKDGGETWSAMFSVKEQVSTMSGRTQTEFLAADALAKCGPLFEVPARCSSHPGCSFLSPGWHTGRTTSSASRVEGLDPLTELTKAQKQEFADVSTDQFRAYVKAKNKCAPFHIPL